MAKKIKLGVPLDLPDAMMMPPPSAPDAGEGGEGPVLSYPELHIGDMPEGTVDQLPDDGEAHIKYHVTERGKRTQKHGKDKGKTKHHVSMEIHHITPTGGGSSGSDKPDSARAAARSFFADEDDKGPNSETPG